MPEPTVDQRWIGEGLVLPTKYYADQPYLAATSDGGILCVVTTGTGHEGNHGQHVLAMKSMDQGKSWSEITPMESPDAPESSWGVPFVTPSGRVFIFYIFNLHNLRELPADDPPYPGGKTQRMDSHGVYCFRWSDDHGKTWSSERGTIPVREFQIDKNNPTGGQIRFFWNVGRAFTYDNVLYLPFHKIGGFGEGWITSSEGGLLRSDDIISVDNPLTARWTTLPEGDIGIRAPAHGGPIAEEHSFAVLSDGTFYTVFRTIDGHPACAYSRNHGQSWQPSEYICYAKGHKIKHPRAACFIWKKNDGGFLLCFHNHGGAPLEKREDRRSYSYMGRNPMWFSRGWEVDSSDGKRVAWSQPEIGFYHDDPMVRISYPDYLEHNGTHLFTETEKATARLHTIPDNLVQALSAQSEDRIRGISELVPLLVWTESGKNSSKTVKMPKLPTFVTASKESPNPGICLRNGFCIRLEISFSKAEDQVVFCNKGNDGSQIRLEYSTDKTLRIFLCDGQNTVYWESDRLEPSPSKRSVTINIDGASKTLVFFCDGILLDGGEHRQYGWGRVCPNYRNIFQGKNIEIFNSISFRLHSLTFYDRILTSAEIDHLDNNMQH